MQEERVAQLLLHHLRAKEGEGKDLPLLELPLRGCSGNCMLTYHFQ